MLIKEHGKQIELLSLAVLNERLSSMHPKKEKVEIDLKIKKAEISGEKELNYPLSYLDHNKYLILHNLRIADENGYFQIDTLLLTQQFSLILEVKNWQGIILFDENGQVTRKAREDTEEEGFKSPIPQVKLQKHRLQKWFRDNGVTDHPTCYLVVISFPRTILKPTYPHVTIPKKVIHNSELFFRIREIEREFTNDLVSAPRLMHLAQQLKAAHEPPTKPILKKYSIQDEELIKGVLCPECAALPMIRQKSKWHCTNCRRFSKNTHLSALMDYKLLIGDRITNREARSFLRVESPHVIKRLMKEAGFPLVGGGKGSKYILKSADKM